MHLMQPPARGAKTPVPNPLRRTSEVAVGQVADRGLEELRLGSPASQIVGRLSRLTRAELRRRERRRCSYGREPDPVVLPCHRVVSTGH